MSDTPARRDDPWDELRRWTDARIALGRSGTSLPTKPLLDFQLAHAMARDAVIRPCDFSGVREAATGLGFETLDVKSRAETRADYLRRPDHGRQLAPESETLLEEYARDRAPTDVVVIVADGLSALATERQSPEFLRELHSRLNVFGYSFAPVVLASQARVALSDEIGCRLKASLAIMLIGERPGLSSPDSLGVYLTWRPRPGLQNADRNCISNVRPAGLVAARAAAQATGLVRGAFHLGVSGIGLKEDSWLAIPESDVGSCPAAT